MADGDFDEENWPKDIRIAKVFTDCDFPILGHDTSADGNLLLVYTCQEILLYDVQEGTLKKKIWYCGDKAGGEPVVPFSPKKWAEDDKSKSKTEDQEKRVSRDSPILKVTLKVLDPAFAFVVQPTSVKLIHLFLCEEVFTVCDEAERIKFLSTHPSQDQFLLGTTRYVSLWNYSDCLANWIAKHDGISSSSNNTQASDPKLTTPKPLQKCLTMGETIAGVYDQLGQVFAICLGQKWVHMCDANNNSQFEKFDVSFAAGPSDYLAFSPDGKYLLRDYSQLLDAFDGDSMLDYIAPENTVAKFEEIEIPPPPMAKVLTAKRSGANGSSSSSSSWDKDGDAAMEDKVLTPQEFIALRVTAEKEEQKRKDADELLSDYQIVDDENEKSEFQILDAQFSPDSSYVCQSTSDRMIHIFATDSGELVRSIALEIMESSPAERERVLRRQTKLDAQLVNRKVAAVKDVEAAGGGGNSKATGSPDASGDEDDDMAGELNLHGRKFVNKYTNHVRASWNPSRAMLVVSNDRRLEWWL